MEQPNITSDVQAALTPVFWLMIALTGVATGLLGALLMVILFNVQHLAFGYHTGTFQAAVEHASAARRVTSLVLAGAFGGVAARPAGHRNAGRRPGQRDQQPARRAGAAAAGRSSGSGAVLAVLLG
jgi:chloride channel protein, CIC family